MISARSPMLGTLAALLVGSALSLAACVSEGPPQREAPRPVPEQPPGLVVDRVVPAIDKLAVDTDRNGYYDTFRVAIFLFSTPYPQSIRADGTLECTLTDPDTRKVMARWTMDSKAMNEAWGLSGVMPGYNFLLDMNQVGTDHVDKREALFSCVFTQDGGAPVEALSRLVVMVGPLR